MLLSVGRFMLPELTALVICAQALVWQRPSLLVYSWDRLPIACSHPPACNADHLPILHTCTTLHCTVCAVGLIDK